MNTLECEGTARMARASTRATREGVTEGCGSRSDTRAVEKPGACGHVRLSIALRLHRTASTSTRPPASMQTIFLAAVGPSRLPTTFPHLHPVHVRLPRSASRVRVDTPTGERVWRAHQGAQTSANARCTCEDTRAMPGQQTTYKARAACKARNKARKARAARTARKANGRSTDCCRGPDAKAALPPFRQPACARRPRPILRQLLLGRGWGAGHALCSATDSQTGRPETGHIPPPPRSPRPPPFQLHPTHRCPCPSPPTPPPPWTRARRGRSTCFRPHSHTSPRAARARHHAAPTLRPPCRPHQCDTEEGGHATGPDAAPTLLLARRTCTRDAKQADR